MIQLQWLDEKGINKGGLYIRDKNDITAIYHKHGGSIIVLQSGKEFLVPYTISELLDMIVKEN